MAFDKQLSDEDKVEMGQRFDYGVHKVTVGSVEVGETADGKGFVEVAVLGQNGEEDNARVWFTTDKATNYAFNTLSKIYVHNAPADKKEAARSTMIKVATVTELVEKMQQVVGGECWFTAYLTRHAPIRPKTALRSPRLAATSTAMSRRH